MPCTKGNEKGAGSAALQDLCLMDEITAAVVKAVPEIPVTVKMRAGWNNDSIVVPEVGKRLEEIGVTSHYTSSSHHKTTLYGKSRMEIHKTIKR